MDDFLYVISAVNDTAECVVWFSWRIVHPCRRVQL